MNERTLNYTWPKLTKYFDIFFTLAPGVGKYSPLQIWRIYRKGWLNEWLVMSLANNTIENTNVGNDPNYEVLLPFPTLSENEVSIPSLFSSDTWTCFRPSNSKLIKSRKINYLISHCFSKTTIFIILCYSIFVDHDGTIVLFSVLETESKIIILFYGKCWIKQNFTFWDGPPAKFGWIQVHAGKFTSYGTTPGMIGEQGPRVSLRSFSNQCHWNHFRFIRFIYMYIRWNILQILSQYENVSIDIGWWRTLIVIVIVYCYCYYHYYSLSLL